MLFSHQWFTFSPHRYTFSTVSYAPTLCHGLEAWGGFLAGGWCWVVMTWMGLWCFPDGVLLAVACKAAGGSEPADVGYRPSSQDTPLLVTPAHSPLLCSSLSGGRSCPCGVFLGLSCPGGPLDDWEPGSHEATL